MSSRNLRGMRSFSAMSAIRRGPFPYSLAKLAIARSPYLAFIDNILHKTYQIDQVFSVFTLDPVKTKVRSRRQTSHGSDERILRICGKTLGFRRAKLFAHDVRSSNQRNAFVECMAAAHSFASHTAVGDHSEAFR